MNKSRVLIDSKQETPITIDTFIKKMRQNGLTLNQALHILSLTNHYSNIKQVVKEINKLPLLKDRIKFKPFVLRAIACRETSPNVYASLKQLATEGGYLEEFKKADAKRKLYSPTDANIITLQANDSTYLYSYYDISSYKKLKIVRDNLPKYVKFGGQKLPEICDFTDVDDINLFFASFSKTSKLIFKKNSTVTFMPADTMSKLPQCHQLPEVLDFSDCDQVYLWKLDLKHVKKIILNNVKSIHLENSINIPDDIDLSSCDFVFLNDAIITNINNLSFKKDSTLELEGNTIPTHLDITNCANIKMDYVSFEFDELTFSDKKSVLLKYTDFKDVALTFNKIQKLELDSVDLENIGSLSFNKVESVTFKNIDLFPATLDLSNCRDVFFTDDCDFGNLKTIKLRDKKQLEHLQMLSATSFDYQRISEIEAKIIYANPTHTLNNQNNLFE